MAAPEVIRKAPSTSGNMQVSWNCNRNIIILKTANILNDRIKRVLVLQVSRKRTLGYYQSGFKDHLPCLFWEDLSSILWLVEPVACCSCFDLSLSNVKSWENIWRVFPLVPRSSPEVIVPGTIPETQQKTSNSIWRQEGLEQACFGSKGGQP